MRFALLGILATKPTHGYDLRVELEKGFGGAWSSVNGGQVYATLGRLERDGLVAGTEAADADGRGKTIYRATEDGRDELYKWLSDGQLEPVVGGELFRKLLIAQRTGLADPSTLLETSRMECLQRLATTQRMPLDDAETGLLGEWIGLRLQADLRWLERCEEWLADQPSCAHSNKGSTE